MSTLTIEPSTEADMLRCAEIMTVAFEGEPVSREMFGPHEPASWAKTARVHWHAKEEHNATFPSVPFAIKCVHTDPASGERTIVGTAEWAVYDRERATPEEWTRDPYTNRLEYMEEGPGKDMVASVIFSMIKARHDLVKGRKYGLLSFMAVDPAWRRKGAATACVRWGMERCRELGVPAYLEATEQGMKAYRKMGWEVVDAEGMLYPPMMWFPEGTERWAKMKEQ